MKKIWNAIARDLWVIVLDIVAVNASYFLALLIRFYVNFQLRPVAMDRYLPNFAAFAPWYTVICLVIFAAWRLYGGLWRYAGINDMNRVIGASFCAAVIHVVGSLLFFTRMPITYYVIGALLQFGMITTIRFAYRVLLAEKRRIDSRKLEKAPVAVVGTGENGRRVLKNLEDTDCYHPVAVFGNTDGAMDGTPIHPLAEFSAVVTAQKVKAVFIADPLLSAARREEISRIAEKTQLEIHDYTGYINNLGGRLSFTELMSVLHAPVTIAMNGSEKSYEDGAAALQELKEKYSVEEISGKDVRIELTPQKRMTTKDALMLEYAAVMGDDAFSGGPQ